MSKENDRRKFLADMLKGSLTFQVASPLYYFVESIFNSAIAAEVGSSSKPRKLISIQQAQGPARWMFDQFLTPYMTSAQLAAFDPQNQAIATRYVEQNGRNDKLSYQTVNLHGINAPYMWGQSVPTPGGSSRPMGDLLLNMLSLQGVSTTNAGHTFSRSLHFKPAGATQSLGALPSDYSTNPLGNVAVNVGNFEFKSIMKRSAVTATYFGNNNNRITSLLSSFIIAANQKPYLDLGTQAPTTNYQSMSRLVDAHGSSRNSGMIESIINKSYAHEMMLDGFADAATFWTTRMDVYNNLITRALDQTIIYPGFNDFPVGSLDVTTRGVIYSLDGNTNIVKHPNLNDLFSLTTLTADIAANFVLAEYLITRDLSNSVCIGMGGLTGLKTGSGLNIVSTPNFDEHFTGSMVSAITNFWYNRAVATCLLELTSQLKLKVGSDGKNYFDETIIELWGDFHRVPRADGSGSDHGSLGKSVMYLSGAINGPVVVGTLGRAPVTDLTGPGVWGQGAVDPALGYHATNGDVIATTANLLRVPSPCRNASPMALLDDTGTITPVASKTYIAS